MNYPTRAEIEELSADDRLRLIDDVWQTFEAFPEDLPTSADHIEILTGRLQRLEQNPESVVDWEDALPRLRKAS